MAKTSASILPIVWFLIQIYTFYKLYLNLNVLYII